MAEDAVMWDISLYKEGAFDTFLKQNKRRDFGGKTLEELSEKELIVFFRTRGIPTNTAFFRNEGKFPIIRKMINDTNKEMYVASMGCSTGNDLYSVLLSLL